MSNISEKELVELSNKFGYKNLLNRYHMMENYFDIKEGDTVIDGGAFHGDMAIYFSKKVGESGRVISLEPVLNNYLTLCDFLDRNYINNVTPLRIGLWSSRERTKFYKSDYPNAGSIRDDFRKVKDDYEIITTDTIDNLAIKLKLNKINFVWTNIEGCEVEALKGMKNTLVKDCPES